MIVDVHTHTPTHRDAVPEAERRVYLHHRADRAEITTNSWADFDAAASAADISIVFNIAVDDPENDTGLAYDPKRCNEATLEFVQAAPDKRIGFMSVHPLHDGVHDEVERWRDAGLVGIKLGANYQRFDPLGDEAMGLYSQAERLGLPILFHQGTSPIAQAPLRYAHPLVTDEIAMRFPELRIVMAHMGHPWVRETVVTIRKHPHVYADISSIYLRPVLCYEALTSAVEWNVTGKLLFGSDFPAATTTEAIDGLRRVNDIIEGTKMPRVPDEAIEGLIHADALTALGIQR